MIKFNKTYALLSVLVFLAEIFIERTTGFVRYTLGDVFAVIFVYSIIKSFLDISILRAALIALGVAFCIEFLQLSNLQHYYPENYKRAFGLLLGSSFSIGDLVAYTCGIIMVLIIEWKLWNLFNPIRR